MRKLLSLAVVLALPLATSAAERDCLVSFSGAEQDVCTGNATTAAPTLQGLLSLDAVADSTLRLVKFNGPITTEQRAAVEAAGARILSYAPHYAYIVRMSPSRDTAMKAIDGVTWSGPLLPALKVDPNIYNQLQSGGIVEGLDIDSLEISIDTDASRGDVRSAFASVRGLSVTNVVESAGELRVRAMFAPSLLSSAVEELALRDDVVAVSFRRPMRLSNSQGHWLHQSGKNTPTPQMPIWNKGLYGCGQIVGELDTGLYMDNVAFKDASQNLPISVCTTGTSCTSITPNLNARKVVSYYKWSGLSGGSWADNHGHGTHVAGSIIGNDNVANPGTDCANFTTPGGDTNLDGMAPGAKLVMQESGGNLAYLNTMGGTPYHAADIAYQNGARIHSNSWGGGCTNQFGQCVSGCTITYDESSRDADKIMQDRSDLLMVFAAGNDARACPNGNNVGSPGNAKNVLTIGGNARGTNGNNTYTSSSRGPTLDSRTKPDLTAQAVGIISASRTTNGTTAMSGTSMATPTAAGNAALVRDYLARGFYPSGVKTPADAIPNPSGALVKAIMAAGAFKMTGSGVGVNPGQDQGFGRILLDDSLYFAGDASQLYIQDATGGLATGGTANYSVNVTGPERLTFILTWSDVAAAVNASPATVNSLRLEVQAPNGDVWTQKLPAGYNVNNADPTQSTATSNYDDINTLQRIQFDTPTPGTYQIRVRGINVPQGPQKFALAATGTFIPGGVTTYTVTPSVGTQSGTISPATPQTVSEGSSATFTLAPASGFQVDNVGGTCGGTLTGLSYVTNAVTANCTVIANFKVADANSLVCSNTINHAIANNIDGTSVNWITGDIQDADVSGYHFNPYNNSNQLTFWWQTGAPNIAGVSSSATSSDFRVLQDGAVVGPSSIWSTTNNPGPAAWAAGADGYLGFRFDCSTLPTAPANGICYGYVHLKTTAPNGFPATLVDYCYDKAGNAVTIGGGTPGGDPVASITPTAISLSAEQGTSDSKPLTIANTGGGSLTYTITESAVARPTSSFATASLRTDKLGNAISGTLSANPNAVNGALGRPVTLLATDISQMTDNTPGDEGVSCGQQSTSTADNSWWRRFYFNEHPAVGASATVQSVKVSTGSISIPSGVPSTINLYTLPHSTPVNTIPTGSLTLIGTANFTATGSLQTITVPVTGAIDDTAGKDLVVEWHTEGNASGGQFFPGANASPQTHPTFISSAACSITDPTATADINFPDFHLTMVVTLDDGGTQPEPGCDNPSDIPWLSATPTSGAVAGGSSSTVTVAGNAGSMAAGSYTANVCVATNDPTHAMTAVPVTLNVTQPASSAIPAPSPVPTSTRTTAAAWPSSGRTREPATPAWLRPRAPPGWSCRPVTSSARARPSPRRRVRPPTGVPAWMATSASASAAPRRVRATATRT
ncbi:MAG: S8 family serine peptidase [Xanthomonadales bacterium]|nr:S8 family serine peptidase [Xanthomonadales bacterium]